LGRPRSQRLCRIGWKLDIPSDDLDGYHSRMPSARLEIKSGAIVLLAYLVAPVPALTGVWLVLFLLPHLLTSVAEAAGLAGILLDTLLIGNLICLTV